jgi:hypothetical protein
MKAPGFKREIVWDGYDPELRNRLIRGINEPRFPYVSFVNAYVWESMSSLAWHNGHSIGILSDRESDDLGSVNLTMTNASFCSVLDEICRQNTMHWGFKENVLMAYPDFFLKDIPGWSRTMKAENISFTELTVSANTKDVKNKEDDDSKNAETVLKTIKILKAHYEKMSALDIIDAVKTKAEEEIKRMTKGRLAVIVKTLPTKNPDEEKFDVELNDISIYDAFFLIGKTIGLNVIFDRESFVFFDETYRQGVSRMNGPDYE